MEKETKEIQLNLDPNVYMITLMNIGFNEESFNFLIASGNQGKQFAASTKHAKRIYLLLKRQIEEYERKFGEIKTQLPTIQGNTNGDTKIGF